MTSPFRQPRGLYLEEFEAGMQVTTAGRTVTETDVVTFAGLSGDFNQIHTDAEFSSAAPFGQRVAHGLLGLSIASGLAVQTGVMEGTVMAFREVERWKFIQPVYIGDTIHVVLNVLEVKPMPRLGGGLLIIELDVRNQDEDTVMKGTWKALIASRPEGNS
jgi:acyl dehydratase